VSGADARWRAILSGLQAAAAMTAVVLARADLLVPPWVQEGDVPPPSWARSVVPRRGDHDQTATMTIFAGPSRSAGSRGVTIAGASLPFFGEKRGSGCSGTWWLVGPLAWVCSDDAELSRTEQPHVASIAPSSSALARPDPSFAEAQSSDEGPSVQYFFVSRDEGTSAYVSVDSAVDGVADHELEGGWAVGITEQRVVDGKRWGRTSKGLWLSMQDLAPAHPSSFHGEELGGRSLDFAWVVSDQASMWSAPSPRGKPVASRARFERVPIIREDVRPGPLDAADIQATNAERMVRVDDARWMLARDLARPSPAQVPSEVTGPTERWIDVDLAAQILVAYEGPRPMYATLVSTGRGAADSASGTPLGIHRVWVKLLTSDMDNVDHEDVEAHYSMEDVPYVQFFDGNVALHGTYWHHDFGRLKSHGCVNLALLDARWLFSFTEPHRPHGWAAVFPTALDPGTVVRVR
jgi:hypothetical protein